MFDALVNYVKFHKYAESIGLFRWVIHQTSIHSNYRSEKIIAKNYIQKKILNSIFDWSDDFFFRYVPDEPLFLSFFERYSRTNKVFKFKDFRKVRVIIDRDIPFLMRRYNKLLFVTYGNDSYVFAIPKKDLLEEIKEKFSDIIFDIDEKYGFILIEPEIVDLPDADYVSYLQQHLDNIYPELFLNRIRNNREFAEDVGERIVENFKLPRIRKLVINDYNFMNLYFSRDYFLTPEKRKQYPFVLVVGRSGSGKTTYLLHFLVNTIFNKRAKHIIFFDTQKTFEELGKYLKLDYRRTFELYLKNSVVLSDGNFYLTESQIYGMVNILLESQNVLSKDEKVELTKLNDEMEFDELLKKIDERIKELETSKTLMTKYAKTLSVLKTLKSFLEKVKPTTVNPFEEIVTKRFVLIQFSTNVLYFAFFYYYTDFLNSLLKTRSEKEYFLFLDETEKYIENDFIFDNLMRLMREKRQFGFRLVATANTVDSEALSKLRPQFNILLYRSIDGYLKQVKNLETPDFDKYTLIYKDGMVEKIERDLFLFNFD